MSTHFPPPIANRFSGVPCARSFNRQWRHAPLKLQCIAWLSRDILIVRWHIQACHRAALRHLERAKRVQISVRARLAVIYGEIGRAIAEALERLAKAMQPEFALPAHQFEIDLGRENF